MPEVYTLHPDTAPCGILNFDDSGVIKSLNQTLVALLGAKDKTEIEGANIDSLLTVAGRIFYQTHFFPLIHLSGHADEIFFTLRKKNGDSLPVICNAVRQNIDGNFIIQCVFIPITQREKYEQELLTARQQAEDALEKNVALAAAKKELEAQTTESDRQVGRLLQLNNDIAQFSRVVSHDLQEAIRKIAVLADKVSLENKSLPSRSVIDLEKINTACRQLRGLAGDLEHYISLDLRPADISAIDLNKVISDAFEDAVPAGFSAHLKAEDLPRAEGSQQLLQAFFKYLFSNFVELHRAGEPLVITIAGAVAPQNIFRSLKNRYRYADFLKITVSSNDGSVHPYKREEMFRLRSRDKKEPATSFGLALCKKIADLHNGSLTADDAPGGGTAITLLLPLKQQAASSPA